MKNDFELAKRFWTTDPNRVCYNAFIDTDIATEIVLSHFMGKNITLLRLSSGYCNTVYKVFVSGESCSFILKFFTRDPSTCRLEADVIEYLSKDIPVPKILVSCYANTPIPYVIYEWVEGETLDTLLNSCCESDTEQAGFEVGVILAKLTFHHLGNCGLFGEKLKIKTEIYSYPDLCIDFILQIIEQDHIFYEVKKNIRSTLKKAAYLLFEPTFIPCLVHGDFRGANIIIRKIHGRWRVAAIIDWEWSFAGIPLVDVGCLLRPESRYRLAFASSLSKGFDSEGVKLHKHWYKIAKLLDLAHLCRIASATTRPYTTRALAVQLIKNTLVEVGGNLIY